MSPFFIFPGPPGFVGPLQPPIAASLTSLGEALGKHTCDPCHIDVTGCSFASNRDAMRQLAESSECTVTGSTTTTGVGVGNDGQPGYGLMENGSMVSVDPAGNVTSNPGPDLPYVSNITNPDGTQSPNPNSSPANPLTTPPHHWTSPPYGGPP